uniref:Uncharacterized protein n=1 Tax=Rhizophora mucronata TaxID=61149 RepID=A0A2P2PUE4_RHIMU
MMKRSRQGCCKYFFEKGFGIHSDQSFPSMVSRFC